MSQWALILRQFGHHRLAVASRFLLVVLYALTAGAEFFAPYSRHPWTKILLSAVPSPDPEVPMNFHVGEDLARLDATAM